MANGIPWQIQVVLHRRRAIATVNANIAKHYNLSEGEQACFVLATSPEGDLEQGICPVFICEFTNGRVVNLPTECVRFIDTDERGEII